MPRKFKDPLDNDEPYEIPDKFWMQLDEQTAGGWLCVYINNFGEIDVACNYQNQVSEEAIRSYAARMLNSLNASKEISETQNFLMDSMPPPEDSDEEDE